MVGSDCPFKALALLAAATVFDPDLITATGNCKIALFCGLHIKKFGYLIHTAEIRPACIDAAAPTAGVEMNAPTITTHHFLVEPFLFSVKGF